MTTLGASLFLALQGQRRLAGVRFNLTTRAKSSHLTDLVSGTPRPSSEGPAKARCGTFPSVGGSDRSSEPARLLHCARRAGAGPPFDPGDAAGPASEIGHVSPTSPDPEAEVTGPPAGDANRRALANLSEMLGLVADRPMRR